MPTVIPDDAKMVDAHWDILDDGRISIRIQMSNGIDSGAICLVMGENTAEKFGESHQRALAAVRSFKQQGG